MTDSRARKPRSDAQKNRELLIEAAKDVLGKGGPNASLEAVARKAGVGVGTLYRHFPTREALFHAVFSHELEHIAELVEGLDPKLDPVAALRIWLHSSVAMIETKRGMLGALSVVMTEESKAAYSTLSLRITSVIDQLLAKGVAAGEIREGVTAEDMLQTMYALCYARAPGPDWRGQVLRLLDIFVDGVRRP